MMRRAALLAGWRGRARFGGAIRAVRPLAGLLLSGALATLVAGCNLTDDFRYYRSGIGSELYAAEIATTTANEDLYLGFVCHRAGLPTIIRADGLAYCDQAADWGLIVQAGMNDIDGRCDGYLAWLDDKRRSNEPFLKQLAATSAATLGILDAASASVKAITITGIAFGLAANTFTNINARILALEQSTVQSVVIDSQRQYRLNNDTRAVQSRPAAIHFLRNYLRICLPFSIETAINNTVTVFHRAGPGALTKNTLFTRTVITDSTKRVGIPDAPSVITGPSRLNAFERDATNFSRSHIMNIQRTLCAKVDGDIGPINSDTRSKLKRFLVAMGLANLASGEVTENIDNLLLEAIAAVPDCTKAGLTPEGVAQKLKG
jgi:hypothetical protein